MLLAGAVLPYVVGLQASTIWDANEAFYAETPREMIESGDYINPTFNYQPRFNKPVLSYWAVALSYLTFGVSERSERLPIAAGAIILIATAFALGRAAWSTEAGLFAALALATTPRFLMFARRIIIDTWITMFMALILLCFVLAEAYPHWRRRCLLLMYVAVALGTLTKGPVAIVLPALAFLIFLARERRLADLPRLMIPTGIVVVSAIVLPWYIALYAQHGWVHIKEFFIDENVMRYAQPVGVPRRGLLFYLPVLMTDLFPWSVLLPAALAASWKAFTASPESSTTQSKVQRLLVIWIVTIVVFFTFSRTKQDLYIFPVVPAEAALVGVVLARASQRSGLLRASLGAAGACVAIVGTGLLVLVVLPGRYPLGGSLTVALVAIAGGVSVMAAAWRRPVRDAAVALGSTFIVLSWVFVLVSLPDFERYKPVAPFASIIAQRATSGARIGYYRFALPSLAFYMRRPVFELFDIDSLKGVFASGDEVHCLMTAGDYATVKGMLREPTFVIARRPLFDVKARTLLEGTALPDIVLVSNRP